jgi:Tfp pilus assembly protein PilO
LKRQHWIVVGAFGGGLILVAWLGWFFVAKPLSASIQTEVETRDAKRVALETARAKAAQYEKFQAQAENYKRDLNFINRRLDPDFSLNELVKIISSLANRAGVNNLTYEFKERTVFKDTKLPGMDRIPVTVKFKAGYHVAAELISEAISQNRILVPEKLTFKGDLSTGLVGAELELGVVMESKEKKP